MQCFIIIIIIKVDYYYSNSGKRRVFPRTTTMHLYLIDIITRGRGILDMRGILDTGIIPGIPAGQVILYIASIQYDDDYDLLGVFLL